MLKSSEIRRQAVQRLRELFPKAQGWEEVADARIGRQTGDFLLKFRLSGQEHVFVVAVSSLGQPRQIRAVVTRFDEIKREIANAYPVATAVYIGSQSARILKNHGFGYVDLRVEGKGVLPMAASTMAVAGRVHGMGETV